MKTIILFVCFLLILILSSCWEKEGYEFRWVNNANYDIIMHSEYYGAAHIYPDTLFNIENLIDRPIGILVKANTDQRQFLHERLEDVIHRTPKDTLSFFYFHADTVNKYSLKILQRDYKILQRYDLSSQDVITLKDRYGRPEIPYPPDTRMKDMKMYPPYGSY